MRGHADGAHPYLFRAECSNTIIHTYAHWSGFGNLCPSNLLVWLCIELRFGVVSIRIISYFMPSWFGQRICAVATALIYSYNMYPESVYWPPFTNTYLSTRGVLFSSRMQSIPNGSECFVRVCKAGPFERGKIKRWRMADEDRCNNLALLKFSTF